MRTILQGGLAGLLAALITSLFWFVDYGPGNSLHTVARWLMLDSAGAGKLVGFLLWLALGVLFGLLFGVTMRLWHPTLGGSLFFGLVTGAVSWLLVVLVAGTLWPRGHLDFGGFLYSSVPLVIYGLLLGSIAFHFQSRPRVAR
jgi:hypothetical protein